MQFKFKRTLCMLLVTAICASSVMPAWAAESEPQEYPATQQEVQETEDIEEVVIPEEQPEEAVEEEPAEEEAEGRIELAGEQDAEPDERTQETLRLLESSPMHLCEIEGIPEMVFYDGAEKTFDITVKNEDGEVMTEGTDYSVEYKNNKDAGTASVVISGMGEYSGEIEKTFRICYDMASAVIADITAVKYNAKPREPAVTVTYDGKELVKDVDYEVSYTNNIIAGKKAKAVVTGIGNYAGTKTKSFKIKRVYNKITASNFDKPYSVKKQTFYIKATALDPETVLTYKSSTSKVKVSAAGKVTVAKEFIGTAKITITAEETKSCASKSKTITVTVGAPLIRGKKLIQSYMTKNFTYKENKTLKVKGLMLHSVNCPIESGAEFIRRWNTPTYTRASVHGFIDAATGEVYQALPWTMQAHHCYKGPNGSGNKTHIGVEMCESRYVTWLSWNKIKCTNKTKAKAAAKRTYLSAVDLFAMLCVQFNLDPMKDGVVISHAEGWERGIASDHGDPENLWKALGLNYTMNGFRKAVKKAMPKYQ